MVIFGYFVNCGISQFPKTQVPAQICRAPLNVLASKDGGWKTPMLFFSGFNPDAKNLCCPDWTVRHLNARTLTSVPLRTVAAIILVSTLPEASPVGEKYISSQSVNQQMSASSSQCHRDPIVVLEWSHNCVRVVIWYFLHALTFRMSESAAGVIILRVGGSLEWRSAASTSGNPMSPMSATATLRTLNSAAHCTAIQPS